MNDKLSYELNEKVLCYHGPLIYEAKILDRNWMDKDPELTGPYYFVHYKGWKRSWDEWVPETRILRWSEENLKMQSRLKSFYLSKKDGKKMSTLNEEDNDSLDGSKKAKLDEEEESYLNKPELRLDIPDTLKGQLVDDWENVTKNQQLVTLPRTITVNDVLARYKRFKRDKKGNNQLHQYANIRKDYPDKELVDIYGAEHFLRLFVQIPGLIAHTDMDPDTAEVLMSYLTDILRFMQKQQKQLFQAEYENAAPGYVALSNVD
ncbi:chromo domain-like protein [Cokeromyces recurvatus]|uniref:chromo domain-like protein n=1 Tax=Cokeromyces recurvatus TaxID=90255 RepID=UPI00221E5425|nr:chromo domain-like protein [Cokeromyces recurvatus]KAI7905273.1 chromo domain-like protein [Cokeromyces recurvatus]